MSLKQLDASLVSDFASAVASGSSNPPIGGGAFAEIAGTQKSSSPSFALGFIYHTGRDKLMTCARIASTGRSASDAMFSLDPGLSLTSFPDSNYNMGASAYFYLLPGQFNPLTGAQKLYTASGTLTFVEEVNPDTLVKSGGAEWSGVNGDFLVGQAHIIGGVGGWVNDHPAQGGAIVFEGLTEGVADETLLTGSNVYPAGLILLGTGTSAGTVAGKSVVRNFVWVDPLTRLAVGVLGGDIIDNPSNPPQAFPLEVDASPVGDSSEAPIDSDEFRWMGVQYLPDSDATFTSPKGQLVFQSGEEIPAIASASPGDQLRQYIRLTDFNPFGVASASGVPTRTHGRIRLTSRALMDVSPMGAVAGAEILTNPGAPSQIQFDPLRQRFLAFMSSSVGLGDSTGVVVIQYSRGPDPVILTSPAARDVPRTADIVTYETFVGGDLGEPVAGVEVDWALTRRSTEDEVINAGTFPGTSQLDNFPIDEDSSSLPELVIEADAVPLALTTDYTVNTTTGLITWVTDQSGAALVTATYNHRSSGATPAHGTLLTQLSITDENGIAQTQVAYADDDDLVGKLDAIESTEG